MFRLSACKRGKTENEENPDVPTLGQLRALAGKYHFPLAVFYLPEPPQDFAPLRDFRRLAHFDDEPISANLAYHIRSAYDRRELALELFQELDNKPERVSADGDDARQPRSGWPRHPRISEGGQRSAKARGAARESL